MPTYASVAPKKDYPVVSSGTHVATVYKFMNLGTRFQEYQGVLKEYPDTLITLTFETDEEHEFTYKNEDGTEEKVMKPLVISKEFTLSMGAKSNLRPFVEGIIGAKLTDEEAGAFDLEDLVGRACLITVVHKTSAKGSVYANITSASPLMKSMQAPVLVNPVVIFDVKTATKEEIEALPKFIQEKITISDEYKKRFAGAVDAINPEDIPFD